MLSPAKIMRKIHATRVHSAQTSGPKQLLDLPNELLKVVAACLNNRDTKNFRLACRLIRDIARLRLDRLFLSANPRNIAVFTAVASHKEFCKQVVEIVWDDARLVEGQSRRGDSDADDSEAEDSEAESETVGVPAWFAHACHSNIETLKGRNRSDGLGCGPRRRPGLLATAEQVNAQLPLSQCWTLFCQLLRQQEDVLRSGADVQVLQEYGLSGRYFPSLKRITVTATAHGLLFNPRYETPMIRAFPYGFNYPIPMSWPGIHPDAPEPVMQAWDSLTEFEKDTWRGFRVVTQSLARIYRQQDEQLEGSNVTCNVLQLVIENSSLPTGINSTLFNEARCTEYLDFVEILSQPGFCRLDLALLAGGQEFQHWSAFRSGLLRTALSRARGMKHIRLSAGLTEPDPDYGVKNLDGDERHFTPLRTIFPIDQWSHLQHFGLSTFLVRQSDLVTVFASMPPTLRSVELDRLLFLPGHGDHRGLLQELRDTVGWNATRRVAEAGRVKVNVRLPLDQPVPGRTINIEEEIYDFLYGYGENPFTGWGPDQVPHGRGTVRDVYMPDYKRPWTDGITMIRMGYDKWPAWLPRDESKWLNPPPPLPEAWRFEQTLQDLT